MGLRINGEWHSSLAIYLILTRELLANPDRGATGGQAEVRWLTLAAAPPGLASNPGHPRL